MVATHFDVIVVGGRVAGSALALRLARAGVRVCLLERVRFPSPTISTHVLHTVQPLRDLGLLAEARAAGAPLLTETRFLIQGVPIHLEHPDDPGLCPRRDHLDTVLCQAAEKAGADVRPGTRVVDVLRTDGATRGVVAVAEDGTRTELYAPVVVGADGRNSTVARAMGARRYLVTGAPRPAFFGYFEGVTSPPGMVWQRPGDALVAGAPTDAGLYLVLTQPTVAPSFRDFDLASYVSSASPDLAALLADARPVGEVRRMPAYPCYFRESAGPGWALLGDAGHFKDVTPGQGINDALRQAQRLAGALVYGLSHPRRLAHALHAYWVWRDEDAQGMYWFGTDLGAAGPLPDLVAAMLRDVASRQGSRHALHEVLAHRRAPSTVLSPGRLLRVAAGTVLAGQIPARTAVREFAALAGTDVRRRAGAALRRSVAPSPARGVHSGHEEHV
jgi:menaquinone-9 beta-reductase